MAAMQVVYASVVAAAVLLLQSPLLRPCWGRQVKGLSCPYDGGECREPEKPWQHDGACIVEGRAEKGKCHLPDTKTFKVAVVVKHRRLVKISGAKVVKELWVRGSGPGLSWEKAVKMKKTAIVDEWKLELEYIADSDGLPCHTSQHCTHNQRSLEFRIYRDEQGHDEMYGPNFFIPLPLSHSMSGAQDFLTPEVTVHPWFDVSTVTVHERQYSFPSEAGHAMGGKTTFECQILLPPSFQANVRKTYPLVIVFGDGKFEQRQVVHLLESLFVYEASIEEAVVVFVGYGDSAPFCRLSPYPGGKIWKCKGGSVCHTCMSCWHPDRQSVCDKDVFLSQAKHCLSKQSCRASGEYVLDFIEQKLLPELVNDEDIKKRIRVDFPRHRVSLIGYAGAGLLACHAAVTRPLIYSNAACLSAPFSWPLQSMESPGDPGYREVFRNASKTFSFYPGFRMTHLTQKYFIGTAEDSFHFPAIDANMYTRDFIAHLMDTLGLQLGDNIMYASIPRPDAQLSSYYLYGLRNEKPLLHHIRYPLLYFFAAEGAASRVLPVQNVESEGGADHKEKSAGVPGGDSVGLWGSGINDTRFFCPSWHKKKSYNIPLLIYLMSVGASIMVAVSVTAALMWLRESSRRAAEEDEKAEAELMGSSDEDLDM